MRLLKLFALVAAMTAVVAAVAYADTGRNFEAILRPAAEGQDGFGAVKFRQPRDEAKIVYLNVWVRALMPSHSYYLQRAVDGEVDDECVGESWLTLGKGEQPKAIETNAEGAGRAALWRDLSSVPTGTEFDIHFRVIDAMTQEVVLRSLCYQYTVRE